MVIAQRQSDNRYDRPDFLRDKDRKIMLFESKEKAVEILKSRGYTDMELRWICFREVIKIEA